ncbi:MAG TPA: ABC transporter ATP-binding protein [Ktedonobacterales bacterium]|nr:ABC transporter ATP-binding protein [Ktedonobacterales bacterium]
MIEAQNLTRHFGDFTAVESISLHVPAGAILALLGPNGAGKTTTIRMLAGLIAPSSGGATVAGYDVRLNPTAVRARVGLVTDAPGLYEQMTAPAYLDFFGAIYGMSRDERARGIDELLALFDLASHRTEKMVGFSKGMKQKVALARALLHDPAVLFLDEPTSGLDPLAARAVRDLILTLKRENRAIILCTHDLDEAERMADEVAILRHGRIVISDAPALLRARASGEVLVRIELAQPLLTAMETIRQVDGVLRPQVENDTHIIYHTTQPSQTNPRALACLFAEGAQIVAVTYDTTSLEDVYANVLEHHDGHDSSHITGTSQPNPHSKLVAPVSAELPTPWQETAQK